MSRNYEGQKSEISKVNPSYREKNVADLKNKDRKEIVWLPREQAMEKKLLILLISRKPDHTACSRVLQVSPYSSFLPTFFFFFF